MIICDRLQFLNPCWIEIFITNKILPQTFELQCACLQYIFCKLTVLNEEPADGENGAVNDECSEASAIQTKKRKRSKKCEKEEQELTKCTLRTKKSKTSQQGRWFFFLRILKYITIRGLSALQIFALMFALLNSSDLYVLQSVLDLSSVLIVVKSH